MNVSIKNILFSLTIMLGSMGMTTSQSASVSTNDIACDECENCACDNGQELVFIVKDPQAFINSDAYAEQLKTHCNEIDKRTRDTQARLEKLQKVTLLLKGSGFILAAGGVVSAITRYHPALTLILAAIGALSLQIATHNDSTIQGLQIDLAGSEYSLHLFKGILTGDISLVMEDGREFKFNQKLTA